MARPIKSNADYFTHDSDMRNDPRIKAIRRKFKHTGFSVWNMLLEVLTDSDNFKIEKSELQIELLSGDFDIEPEWLTTFLDYCIAVELLQEINGFILSKRHIERFSALINKRKRDRNIVIADDNPQSRVKKSKEEKSKEKEIDKSISDDVHSLADHFSFSEIRNPDKLSQICSFISILKTDKRLEYFREQFEAYKLFKEKTGERQHAFHSFIGHINERFADGGWNSRNWIEELKNSKSIKKGLADEIDDVFERLKKQHA